MIADQVRVRPAVAGDAAALAQSRFRFRSEVIASSREDERAFVSRATRVIDAHLRSGRWFAWIAEQDGRLVGHVFLELFDKLPNPSPDEPELNGYLTSFFVEPAFRGGGVGTLLIEALEAHAIQAQVDRIVMIGTTPGARSLYARLGYASDPDYLAKRPR